MVAEALLALALGGALKDVPPSAPTFRTEVTEVQPSNKIKAFWPVPKKGCPKGWYEVGHTFYTGVDWEAGCWNNRLNVIEEDHRVLKVRRSK